MEMNKILLDNNYGFKWKVKNKLYYKGYIYFDGAILTLDQLELLLSSIKSFRQFNELLKSFNGSFSLIYETSNSLWTAVDHTRTFPLFYCIVDDSIVITDNTYNTIFLDFSKSDITKKQLLGMRYVLGKNTILENVYQIRAGESLMYNGEVITNTYHDFTVAEEDVFSNCDELSSKFLNITSTSIKRLLKGVNNRTLVIPLSGGYDSRFILSLIFRENYENVICYTYGSKDDEDVQISKKVAKEFGYKWLLLEPSNIEIADNYRNSEEFAKFVEYCYNNVSLIVLQDFFYVKQLKEKQLVPDDAIFIPGHSGDFLVGNHLYKDDKKNNAKNKFVSEIIKRHHVLREFISDDSIKNVLEEYFEDNKLYYSLIDNYNYKERQSKYIVNSLRIYEFFGYEHRMLLWDLDLSNFFKKMPFDLKFGSKFYREEIFTQLFHDLNVAFVPKSKSSSIKDLRGIIKPYLPITFVNKLRKLRNKKGNDFGNLPHSNMLNNMNADLNKDIVNQSTLLTEWTFENF
ncbi:MAG: asparagine synthase (glutamine-hydrolyzing) [Dokdonia donghaensis]|jgi:asparagine synthase (glutamine-hydrolysing)